MGKSKKSNGALKLPKPLKAKSTLVPPKDYTYYLIADPWGLSGKSDIKFGNVIGWIEIMCGVPPTIIYSQKTHNNIIIEVPNTVDRRRILGTHCAIAFLLPHLAQSSRNRDHVTVVYEYNYEKWDDPGTQQWLSHIPDTSNLKSSDFPVKRADYPTPAPGRPRQVHLPKWAKHLSELDYDPLEMAKLEFSVRSAKITAPSVEVPQLQTQTKEESNILYSPYKPPIQFRRNKLFEEPIEDNAPVLIPKIEQIVEDLRKNVGAGKDIAHEEAYRQYRAQNPVKAIKEEEKRTFSESYSQYTTRQASMHSSLGFSKSTVKTESNEGLLPLNSEFETTSSLTLPEHESQSPNTNTTVYSSSRSRQNSTNPYPTIIKEEPRESHIESANLRDLHSRDPRVRVRAANLKRLQETVEEDVPKRIKTEY